jgi:protein ImuB
LRSAPPPNPYPLIPHPSNPQSLIPNPCLYACLYSPPVVDQPAAAARTLLAVAQEFSPRFERHRDDLVSVDVSGLTRLLGPSRAIGEEMRREAAARGVSVHVAVAGTRTAAVLLALARPGLTVIAKGEEASALASLPLALLETVEKYEGRSQKYEGSSKDEAGGEREESADAVRTSDFVLRTSQRWGLKTLGELAALPSADLVARFGRSARTWQAMARGEDIRPLVPMLEAERFEASLDLEWPITDLEPLSFVLTRLLEPLSTRLERRDRGAAVLHVLLRLVTRDPAGSGRETCVRRLELPTPMRDVRALRTLALLDLEAHPADAAIDRVTIVIDPTPGRVVQHTLYARAQPTPEQLSTLLARLGALMGADRFGAPAIVDTDRPGAFAMTAFATDHEGKNRRDRKERGENVSQDSALSDHHGRDRGVGQPPVPSPQSLLSALRRCRQPVPARVAVADGRPVRVTTDRRGFTGGTVTRCAGPWRTSGNWWEGGAGGAGRPGGDASVSSTHQPHVAHQSHQAPWDRDEWDVSLSDGAVYRVFRDRDADRWFVDAIVD